MDQALVRIAEAPRLYAEIDPGIRRASLHGFPYSLAYAIRPHEIVVLAVMHHKRLPGYWRDRG